MVSRCDFYSEDEYLCALAMEEEYYREEQAKEEYYRAEYESFCKVAFDYHENRITKEEALSLIADNALGYTWDDFLKELDAYSKNENEGKDERD